MNTVVVVRLRSVHALRCKFLALGVGHVMASLVSYYGVPNDHAADPFVTATRALLHLSVEPRGKSVFGHLAPVSIHEDVARADIAHLLLFLQEPK